MRTNPIASLRYPPYFMLFEHKMQGCLPTFEGPCSGGGRPGLRPTGRGKTFRVWGVHVRSRQDLFPSPEVVAPPDLRVVYRSRPPSAQALESLQTLEIRIRAGRIEFRVPRVAVVALSRRNTVTVAPCPGATPRWLCRLVVDLVVPTWLFQRGYLVLHGSAVAYQGRAFGFLGFPGAGKSTLAAGLYMRGLSFLSDDVLVIDLSGPRPTVRGGPPILRLSADVYTRWASLLPSSLLYSEDGKAEILVPRDPVEECPLYGLGVIEEGPHARLEAIPSREATLECLRHTRGIRWLASLRPESHLMQCVRLASRVPVVRLTRPRDLTGLDSWVQAVYQHLVGV